VREKPSLIPQNASNRVELAVLGLVTDEPRELRLVAPSLIATVESAVADVRCRGRRSTVDRSNYLVAARGDIVTLAATGAASRVAIIGFRDPVIDAVVRDYGKLGVERRRLARWLGELAVLPRTVWIHELVHRYLFERHALGETDNLALRFLEIELAKELYFAFRDRDSGAERASIVRSYSPAIDRALAYIEAHLFDDGSITTLSRHAGASARTLLRLFRSEIGCSPAAYWRDRKLDEALLALRGGASVGDVAARVGYENPTAFGFAFRRRFGRPPSAFRPSRRVRRAP
jgi:AraC-like DNA-binding protein